MGHFEAEHYKKITIKFWTDVLNDQKFDEVSNVVSPDYKFNGEPSSPDQTRAWVQGMHKEIPDIHFTIEDILAENNKVALRWRMTGTDAKTNVKGYSVGTNILVFHDGKAISNDQSGGDKFIPITS
jgi:predicted ester cyclase